jgi:PAT family beta-lactamase induction signal transducer AmpG
VPVVFEIAALIFAVLAVLAWRAPNVPVVRQPTAAWMQAFVRWLARPGAAAVLLFILLYKLGDVSMGPMVKPSGSTAGSPSTTSRWSRRRRRRAHDRGRARGRHVHSRYGSSTGSGARARCKASRISATRARRRGGGASRSTRARCSRASPGSRHGAFLAFLMHVCEREQAATQYALLSALFGLTRSVSAPFTGIGAAAARLFRVLRSDVRARVPAFALLPWIRTGSTTGRRSAASRQRLFPDGRCAVIHRKWRNFS